MHPLPTFVDQIAALPPREFVRQLFAAGAVRLPAPPAPSAANLRTADQVLHNCFELVGEAYTLPARFSWKHNPSRDKEWQIAQHKFYFAVDLAQAYRQTLDPAYLRAWARLIERWLDQMGTGFIHASDAQVEAKRVEHWVRSLALLRGTPAHRQLGEPLLRRMLERIVSESLYILEHLRPARNHRTFQLFAVFLVGALLPQLRLARHFLDQSVPALTANLLCDFLPDGVHVELSTHYHQLVLETGLAFVELAQLNGIPLDPALLPRLARALEFSMFVQWPDGELPLLNDSDTGDQRPMLALGSRLLGDERLLWAATQGRIGQPPAQRALHCDYAGYLVLSDGWGHDQASYRARQHVVYDCAQLGEGSHSHYDLFNFCYFVNGAPAIIDPGRYTYCAEPDTHGIDWREQFKSTAYHNTVTVDGRDQTRYISKFRRPAAPPGPAAPRAKHGPAVQIRDKRVSLGQHTDYVSAVAQSAEYEPLHRRTLVYMQHQYLLIVDELASDNGEAHDYALRFHLAEHCRGQVALEAGAHQLVARAPQFAVHSCLAPGIAAQLGDGWASTLYGVKSPAPVLTISQRAAGPALFASLVAPSGGALAIHTLHRLPAPADMLLLGIAGEWRGRPFADWLLLQSPAAEPISWAGLTFQGRCLAWREDAPGHVFALKAVQARRLSGDQIPHFSDTETRVIEWSATLQP